MDHALYRCLVIVSQLRLKCWQCRFQEPYCFRFVVAVQISHSGIHHHHKRSWVVLAQHVSILGQDLEMQRKGFVDGSNGIVDDGQQMQRS